MADYTKYTKQEMQAYAIAKNIKENQIVIVGTGLPLIGASLAKRVVCPSCHPIVESGLMDCSPVEVPRSVGDLCVKVRLQILLLCRTQLIITHNACCQIGRASCRERV